MSSWNRMTKMSVSKVRFFSTHSSPVSQAAQLAKEAAPARPRLEALRRQMLQDYTIDDFVNDTVPEVPEVPSSQRVSGGFLNTVRKPKYLLTDIPKGETFNRIKKDVRELKLATVCEQARCPNIGQCWGGSKENATATIMLMGDTCTRACRFCSIKTSRRPPPLNPDEPENTANAIMRWGVGYIVLTSVDRDDIADAGAYHFSETIRRIKQKAPHIIVEALTPDFNGMDEGIRQIATSGLDVLAHNVETVEELTPEVRDPRATYHQSLYVLRKAKEFNPKLITKTSIMLGFGETDEQILRTLHDLRANQVDVVTFGQYMRPTRRHKKVKEYLPEEKFDELKTIAENLGFLYVASGPLVRSSFKAGELLKSAAGKRFLGRVNDNNNAEKANAVPPV